MAGLPLALFWAAWCVPLALHHLLYVPLVPRLKVGASAQDLPPAHLALPILLLALLAALLLAAPVLSLGLPTLVVLNMVDDLRKRQGDLDAAVSTLVAALTAPLAGAVRETKALYQSALHEDLDTQCRLEREAQTRRFREMSALLQG